jgi:hypothetical protein
MRFIVVATFGFCFIASSAIAQEITMRGTIQGTTPFQSNGEMYYGSTDSLFKRWKVDTSGTVIPWSKFYDQGSGMKRGTLLDNRSETDGFIKDGQKFYIRNFRPDIDPKPFVPGSTIYPCK